MVHHDWSLSSRLRLDKQQAQNNGNTGAQIHRVVYSMTTTATKYHGHTIGSDGHKLRQWRPEKQGSCPFVKIKFKDFSRTFKDHTKDI